MAINVGSPEEEGDLNSTINTTPLVDIMLVLLIIFLITVPVVVTVIPVQLPKEHNIPTQTKPENIVISVDKSGQLYWGTSPIDFRGMLDRLKVEAVKVPQPELHVRADRDVTMGPVMSIIIAAQRASIFKIGFILEPPAPGEQ